MLPDENVLTTCFKQPEKVLEDFYQEATRASVKRKASFKSAVGSE